MWGSPSRWRSVLFSAASASPWRYSPARKLAASNSSPSSRWPEPGFNRRGSGTADHGIVKLKNTRDILACLTYNRRNAPRRERLEQGGLNYGGSREGNRKPRPVVEGAEQGSMVRLVGGVAGVDPGRVRLHRLPADHEANRR